MSYPTFELIKSTRDNHFYFHLKAENGKITLASEGYSSKQACENGIDSVRLNAVFESRYEKRNENGHYSFVLKAINGITIGHSESYTTAYSRDQGIKSVMSDAPDASIIDLT